MDWYDLGIYIGCVGCVLVTILACVNWTVPQFYYWTAVLFGILYVLGGVGILIHLFRKRKRVQEQEYEAVVIDLALM